MKFEKYTGTKRIEAVSMNRGTADKYITRKAITRTYNPDEEGYLVKYSDKYISWSPKKAFEETYRKSGEMTFGHALEMLKKGFKVARKGWNGKGMYLFIMKGGLTGTEVHKSHPYLDYAIEVLDCICMKTAQNTVCVGWLASQTDMLAEDWEVIGQCAACTKCTE